jgi:dynein heavy chain
VADVITTIESLSALNTVKLEGLESITLKYKNIVENIKKKSYDILDHRKPEFEVDYNEFKAQIDALQLALQTFIDTWSRNAYTSEQSLEFLEKFQRLDGVRIDYNGQYSKLLQEYSRELDTVRKLYEKNKQEPVMSRNLPPISGRIAWARQLYRRITTPIRQLAKRPDIIKSEEGKLVVRNYNRMAQVLLEYELVHYR